MLSPLGDRLYNIVKTELSNYNLIIIFNVLPLVRDSNDRKFRFHKFFNSRTLINFNIHEFKKFIKKPFASNIVIKLRSSLNEMKQKYHCSNHVSYLRITKVQHV